MLWTEEAIETLKALALEGRSARAIAEALGAPSRSAVIGKANRIGVKLNGGGSGRADRPRTASAPRVRAAGERDPRTVSSRRAIVHALPRESRRAQWIFAGAEVGDMLRLGLEEIAEGNCRWPLGDPLSEDFAYCGLPPAKGRSYCAGHCRMAYQPPKQYRENGGAPALLPGGRVHGGAAILAFPPPAATIDDAPDRTDIQTACAPSGPSSSPVRMFSSAASSS